MADAPQQPAPYDPTSGALHPTLAQLPNQFASDGAKQWAGVVAQQLQGHVTTQAIANQADAAGQQTVNDVGDFKNGLVAYVRKDPTALDTALAIIPHTIAGIASGHPDEATGAQASQAITAHIQGEAVKSAAQAWAEQNEGVAHAMLDKYSSYLSPEDHDALRSYTTNMAMMRQADSDAATHDTLRQIHNGSNGAAVAYLSEMSHPDTGQLQFPPRWGQRMMSDPTMLAPDKAALLRAYATLQTNGEPAEPNAGVVSSIVDRTTLPANHPDHPTPAEVIGHVGSNLGAQDAAWLAGRTGPQTAAVAHENQQLSDTLNSAREQIGNPQAYQRFMTYFLPAYQRQTALGLNPAEVLSPESPGYVLAPERLQRFMPSGNDVVARVPQAGPRKSLTEIFGGR